MMRCFLIHILVKQYRPFKRLTKFLKFCLCKIYFNIIHNFNGFWTELYVGTIYIYACFKGFIDLVRACSDNKKERSSRNL